MSRVRGKDTKPELIVRRMLHGSGYRFRLHRRDLPGTPDLAFPSRRIVIFVHGCFWHRHEHCRRASIPKTRVAFWEGKFRRNVERDRINQGLLEQAGWKVVVVWECQTIDPVALETQLRRELGPPGRPRSEDPALETKGRPVDA